jgi:PEP-CTERM motif-containing protein
MNRLFPRLALALGMLLILSVASTSARADNLLIVPVGLGLSVGAEDVSRGNESLMFCTGCEAPHAVPEPTAMFLLGTGLAGLAAAIRKRRNAAKSQE